MGQGSYSIKTTLKRGGSGSKRDFRMGEPRRYWRGKASNLEQIVKNSNYRKGGRQLGRTWYQAGGEELKKKRWRKKKI